MPYSFAALNHRFISIAGTDAIKFLQGQCSCDLLTLQENQFTFGTLNTPKGRMYSLFKLIKTEQGLLLSLEESLLEATLEKLRKYAAFFKCELKEATHYKALGLFNARSSAENFTLEQSGNSYALTLSRKQALHEIWLADSDTPEQIAQRFPGLGITADSGTQASPEHWYALETQLGIPALYKQTQEEFILQTLNLQLLGAVSFKKGCYTGQEIIARMKFLGKLKKKCYLLQADQRLIAEPNQSVLDTHGNKSGTVVRSHWSEQTGSVTLAVLNIEDAQDAASFYLEGHTETAFKLTEPDYSEFNH
jgi:folate-binding protein YgfZ